MVACCICCSLSLFFLFFLFPNLNKPAARSLALPAALLEWLLLAVVPVSESVMLRLLVLGSAFLPPIYGWSFSGTGGALSLSLFDLKSPRSLEEVLAIDEKDVVDAFKLL